jgi:hypothetical protein
MYEAPNIQKKRRRFMVVHRQAIKGLAPADYLVIETEHKLLDKYLSDLHDACACSKMGKLLDCQGCSREQQTSCQGRLPSFLLHIIDLAGEHFCHEETIMLSRPHVNTDSEYFRIHQQAHVDLMRELYALSDECLSLRNESNVAEVFSRFYKKLSELFEAHDRDFDDPFIESTKTS